MLIAFLGPNLKSLIVSAQVMCPNLVVNDAHNAFLSVLAGKTNVDLRL